MSDLEDALTRTLAQAAESAPPQPPGLAHEVDVRFRRRRRRSYAAVAGFAVFAVIGGSAIATGWLTGDRGPGPSVVAVPPAAPGKDPEVATVWPKAYHKVSAKLADGRKYQPQLLVNDHELLVTTEASFENADELWIIDLDTSKARRVTKLPEPAHQRELYASGFTTGSGQVVWWDAYSEDGKHHTRIWKAPLTGGEPSLVATVPGQYGGNGPMNDRLVVDSGHVYFSAHKTGGVTRIRLAGGKPAKVPGTEGYHIVSWPWVGSPGGWEAQRVRCEQLPSGGGEESCVSTARPSQIRIFTRLWNLKTDATENAEAISTGLDSVICGVTYCVGGEGRTFVARSRDGSREQSLPGWVDTVSGPPALDRFVVTTGVDHGAPRLYDLRTGKSADLGITPNRGGSMQMPGFRNPDDRLLSWQDEDSYLILDVAAIR